MKVYMLIATIIRLKREFTQNDAVTICHTLNFGCHDRLLFIRAPVVMLIKSKSQVTNPATNISLHVNGIFLTISSSCIDG